MQENRSFDSYFGQLHVEGQKGVEAEPTTGNPNPLNPAGPPIKPFHKTNYCETADLNHSWQGTHLEWDNGLMDGFTAQNDINSDNSDSADPTGSRTMGYYDQSDLPFYYALANTFGVGDRYFASVLGPTFPNRFYLYAGTSFGHIANDIPGPSGFEDLLLGGSLRRGVQRLPAARRPRRHHRPVLRRRQGRDPSSGRLR
ncbi:MAG: hypothetical protein E6G01_14200 [Actinobacteria bacterium]|nr:MAG: hypothetical protein E6G01_14200 [Actinomycetota bacterium]